jgi:hypothetical protein
MKLDRTPVLDPRNAEEVFSEIIRLQPAWVPELKPFQDGPSGALWRIFARYMQSVIERLNQAPDKNLLAFLDTLGVRLIPPKPARAPVVFTPVPNAADAIIPSRTRLSAKVPGRTAPLIFETERQNAMAAAKLTDVITLWPTRDEYVDHSTEAAGKRPFVLFADGRPVPHEFYLAHNTVFAFSGKTAIDIEFDLASPGSEQIDTKWEFWDGQVWRPFRDIDLNDPSSGRDGTNGFTRSGILSLRAECGDSKPTKVNAIEAHWIRGRVIGRFPPDPGRALPMLDRVRVRSVVESGDMSPFPPDSAFADSLKLDVSKAFYPFDQQPHTGSAFYLSAASALGKPGAQVTLSATNVQTALESSYAVTTAPTIAFEYWNGTSWTSLGVAAYSFINSGGSFEDCCAHCQRSGRDMGADADREWKFCEREHHHVYGFRIQRDEHGQSSYRGSARSREPAASIHIPFSVDVPGTVSHVRRFPVGGAQPRRSLARKPFPGVPPGIGQLARPLSRLRSSVAERFREHIHRYRRGCCRRPSSRVGIVGWWRVA